jgi:hypothetical protein
MSVMKTQCKLDPYWVFQYTVFKHLLCKIDKRHAVLTVHTLVHWLRQ